MSQIYAVCVIVLLGFSGLITSNYLYDHGARNSLARRAAHVLGGAAILMAVLWLDVWTAVTVSGLLAFSILILRLGFRRTLRGVGRTASTHDWAEIAYPMAATVSLAVGWGLLGDRWLAFVPIAFMAWGDSVAGLVRATIRRGSMARIWPSMAMLGVCLTTALLFQPYWIGVLGAMVATVAERFRLIAHGLWDDNWVPDDPVIVAASLTVMVVLTRANFSFGG